MEKSKKHPRSNRLNQPDVFFWQKVVGALVTRKEIWEMSVDVEVEKLATFPSTLTVMAYAPRGAIGKAINSTKRKRQEKRLKQYFDGVRLNAKPHNYYLRGSR